MGGVLLHFLSIILTLALVESFHFAASRNHYKRAINNNIRRYSQSTQLPLGLYEEDIDWDADLFGQIAKDGDKSSNTQPSTTSADAANNERQNNNTMEGSDGWADDQWDNIQPKSKKNIKSMRDQMKQSWGEGDEMGNGKEEGKPTADWVGVSGPDEDEPWFTG